jgi:hypothetical protein
LPRLTIAAERSSEDRTDFRDVASVGASVLMVLGMFLPLCIDEFSGREGAGTVLARSRIEGKRVLLTFSRSQSDQQRLLLVIEIEGPEPLVDDAFHGHRLFTAGLEPVVDRPLSLPGNQG